MFANPISLTGRNQATFGNGPDLLSWGNGAPLCVMRVEEPFHRLRPHPVPSPCVHVSVARGANATACAILAEDGFLTLLNLQQWHPMCMPIRAINSPDACLVTLTNDGSVVATADTSGLVRMWHLFTPHNKPFCRHLSLRRISSMSFDARGWLYACDISGQAFCLAGITITGSGFSAKQAQLLELNGPDGSDELPRDFEVYSVSAQPEGERVVLAGTGAAYLIHTMPIPQTTEEDEAWKATTGVGFQSVIAMDISPIGNYVRHVEFLNHSTFVLYGKDRLQVWRLDPSGELMAGELYGKEGQIPRACRLVRSDLGEDLAIALSSS